MRKTLITQKRRGLWAVLTALLLAVVMAASPQMTAQERTSHQQLQVSSNSMQFDVQKFDNPMCGVIFISQLYNDGRFEVKPASDLHVFKISLKKGGNVENIVNDLYNKATGDFATMGKMALHEKYKAAISAMSEESYAHACGLLMPRRVDGSKDGGLVDDDPLPAQNGQSTSMKFYLSYYYYDIQGIHNGNLIQTTYSNQGYNGVIKVDDGETYGISGNELGKVYETDGIQYKQHVSLIDNGSVVKFGYTLYNKSDVVKTVKIGNHTDTQIGDNDGAGVYLTNAYQKISMTDDHTGSCTSKGLKYTITADEDSPFNGAWIGYWNQRHPFYFHTPSTTDNQSYTGHDSGITFHWKKTLQPGQTTSVWCYFEVAPALVIEAVNLTADAETSQVHFDIPYKDLPNREQTLYYTLQGMGKQEEPGNTNVTDPKEVDAEGFVHRSFYFDANVTEWPSNTMRTIDLYADDNAGYRSKDYHFEVWWPEWVPQQTYSTVSFKNTVKNFADVHGLIGESITLPTDESDAPGMSFGGWNDKADGTGTTYKGGDQFTIPNRDTTLYAQWKISPDALTYINEDQYYTGQEIREIKVKYGTTIWEEGIDYTITYTNNINVGQASAIITSDKLTTDKTLNFNIMKATNQWVTTPSVANVPLGTEVEPVSEAKFGTATVTYEGISGTEYASSTTKPTAAGNYKATFTIAETTNYSPELTVTDVNFKIYVAEVLDGTTVLGAYPTVQDAINAAENGNTVRIGCDIAENIVVDKTGMTITLDLNGKTLRPSKYEKPSLAEDYAFLITVKTPLIIDDSSEGKTGLITTQGTDFKTGGVYATANITLNNGTITTSRTGTVFSNGGGVYVQTKGTFTMNGGAITGCHAIPGEGQTTNGGGVYINDGASFVMNDGIISNNSSDKGGGVSFNGGNRIFTMTGGTITGNTAAQNKGGGVFMWGATGIVFNVGGTAKIYGNNGNNVYLDNENANATMTVNTAFAEGAQIYVTTSTAPETGNPVAVTSNGASSDVKYFRSDNPLYAPVFSGGAVKLALIEGHVCQIVETGVLYTTVQEGVNATTETNKTVQMINNSNENVTLPANSTVYLDLNGKVLKASAANSVIEVGNRTGDGGLGHLTLTDSDPDAVHYFTVGSNGLWTLNTEAPESYVAYESLTARPEAGTVVAVKGGCITGGVGTVISGSTKFGGGVLVSYDGSSFTMNGGNIVGNTVGANFGGGVSVGDNVTGTVTINSGRIIGNTGHHGSALHGHQNSTITITDGDIAFNGGDISGNYGAGAVKPYNNLTMSGGFVRYNKGGRGAGFDIEQGNVVITGGSIIGNETTNDNGGGIWMYETQTLTLGGTVYITGNKKGDSDRNLYLPEDIIVKVSDTPLTTDAIIGVTSAKTPAPGTPVAITSNGATSDVAYFVSDNKAYVINYDTDHLVLAVPTCYLYDGDTFVAGFNSVQKAIDAAAGDSIVMHANSNENVVFPEGKTYALNLNGYVLKGTGDGSVITNNGTLTLTDSNPTAEHKFTPDEDGLWVLDETSGTKTVNGGCITNGNNNSVSGGIYNYGTLTMNGGNVVGNKSQECGAGIYTGREIEGISALTMNGGNIIGNFTPNTGGGIGTNNYCVVKLLGGNIKYNVGAYGGGVESGWQATNPYTLGGNIVITDNTSLDGATPNNLYLYDNFTCTISTEKPLTEDASIGVSSKNAPTATAPVPVTSNGTKEDMAHFSSDGNHQLNYAINHIEMSVDFVCELYDDVNETTLLARFSCVQSAVSMATSGQLVKMTDNSEESVRIYAPENSDLTLTLDLNGYVLDATTTQSGTYIARPAISVYNRVTLNIIDSNPDANHYFTVEETTIDSYTAQKWTLNKTATEGDDWTTLTARPAVGDNILVKGGIITGGDAFRGGGIDNKGTVNMKAGTIVGNIARTFGGGIISRSFSKDVTAVTNLYDNAAVIGNWSVNGGGICVGGDSYNTGNGSIDMKDNSRISFNTSVNGGGLWLVRDGKIYGNSKIDYNAAVLGGGIYFAEATQTVRSLIFGNEMAVVNNFGEDGVTPRNLFVDNNSLVTVGTGEYALDENVTISTSVAKSGDVTTPADADNTKYFTSENTAYEVFNNGKDGEQQVFIGTKVAYIAVKEHYYGSVQDAVVAATTEQDIIQMIANSTENVTIATGKDVTLDLNDKVLTAKSECTDGGTDPKEYVNRAILVEKGAKLVINDNSETKTTRYITKDNSDPTLTYKYMVTETPNDSVVEGGLIVGGWTNVGNNDGLGILNLGTLTINGGTIAGCACVNATTGDGAGVCNKGVFTMTGGELCYNTAMISGGGLCNKGDNTVTATITGGKIHHNITVKEMNFYSYALIGIGGGIANLESAVLTLGSDSPTQEDDVEINNNSTSTSEDNMGFGGGGIANVGTLAIKAGVSLHDNVGMYGGGVMGLGNVTMSGGKIYGNNGYRGGGVCNACYYGDSDAKFRMTGGKIYNNVATMNGGGLVNIGNEKAVVTILGGEITGNIGSIAGGLSNEGYMTLGGNVKISGNKVIVENYKMVDNNLVVIKDGYYYNYPITISTDYPLENTEAIGVSIYDRYYNSYNSGIFTTSCDIANKVHFKSDSDIYDVTYRDGCLALGKCVAVVVENGYYYDAVQDAINAVGSSGKTVKLVKNVTENVTVYDGQVVTLDLNGKVIESTADDATVITNNGMLTLTDSKGGGNVTGGAKGVEQNGILTVGGKLNITGNTANLYLPENNVFSVGTGDNKPVSGMMVGITPFEWQSSNIITVSTENGTKDYSQYFKTDNEDGHFGVYADNTDSYKLKIGTCVKVILTVAPKGVAEVKVFNAETGTVIENPNCIIPDTKVKIKVTSVEKGWAFKGWFNTDGTLFSGKYECTFTATQNFELEARFTDQVIWVRVKKGN